MYDGRNKHQGKKTFRENYVIKSTSNSEKIRYYREWRDANNSKTEHRQCINFAGTFVTETESTNHFFSKKLLLTLLRVGVRLIDWLLRAAIKKKRW